MWYIMSWNPLWTSVNYYLQGARVEELQSWSASDISSWDYLSILRLSKLVLSIFTTWTKKTAISLVSPLFQLPEVQKSVSILKQSIAVFALNQNRKQWNNTNNNNDNRNVMIIEIRKLYTYLSITIYAKLFWEITSTRISIMNRYFHPHKSYIKINIRFLYN